MSASVKLAICVPSGDMVHMDFATSLGVMLARLAAQRVQSSLYNIRTTILSQGRQTLVNQALAADATHLLFLDSDMSFPPDTAMRLLSHNLDIVGIAAAMRRENSLLPSALKRWGERVSLTPDDGLVEVDYLGFGGILIRRAVFKAIDKPWFPISFRETHPEKGDIWIGEDYGFCEKARAAGYRIHVDAGLSFRFGHMGQRRFRLSDARN
ncbi:hypothetical protein [Minwuia sp.]|uniref:hypothetical protein n=1 Tax=Minwuia sp. TaxID=2493630 RepID=UPI003A8E1EED